MKEHVGNPGEEGAILKGSVLQERGKKGTLKIQ